MGLGPCAVALSYEDSVAPAKILMKFTEGQPRLEVKVGVVEGQVVDLAGIKRLSKLPSREVLLAQLVWVMNAPATGLVTVLSGGSRNVSGTIEASKRQKEGLETDK